MTNRELVTSISLNKKIFMFSNSDNYFFAYDFKKKKLIQKSRA